MHRFHYSKWVGLAVVALVIGGCDFAPSSAKAGDGATSAKGNTALVRDGGAVSVPEQSPLRKSLMVTVAAEETVERPIVVPGSVEADPAKLVKAVPPVAGRVLQIRKRLGDTVRKGEVLFTMDSADLAQAVSDSSKGAAALTLARRNLERQKALSEAGISARKELEQAESEYSQAASELQRSRARLSLLGATTGQTYAMRSPIAGQVIELAAGQGAFWNDTNAAVMTVADLSTVWLTASVQEKDLGALYVGQAASVALNAYPGESFTGRVRYVGAVLEPETRTVKVRIAVENRSGRFRPGMFASVTLKGQPHRAITVPTTALLQSGFNTRVYIEKTPWRFEARTIRTGAQLGDRTEILAGIAAGDRVVVKDGVLIND